MVSNARSTAWAAVAALATLATACGGGSGSVSTVGSAPATSVDGGQMAGCTIASDPYNPFIVEWPAAEKTNLEVQSKRGLVVVSYVGCHLKVLPSCDAAGQYAAVSSSLNSDHFALRDEAELYARLPLGAASLAADLKHQGAMNFSYASRGQRVAEKPPSGLSGRCEGATHYVRSLTIGAFRLGALSSTSGAAGVGVGTAGAGGSGRSQSQRGRAGGDLETCLSSQGASGCDAILQLGLVELNLGAKEAGFGAGLGSLVNVPQVQVQGEADGLGAAAAMSFGDLDMTWLKLVEAATLADGDESQPVAQRVVRWRAVADYAQGDANLKAKAKDRADAWQRHEDARLERRKQVEAAHQRYTADAAKLEQLLGISDRVVSATQKKAYQQEFERVYAPWKKAFEELGKPTATPAANADSGAWVSFQGGGFSFQGKKSVTLRPFAIGKTEVTVAEYRRCVDAGQCDAPDTDGSCNWGKSGRGQHPVNCVDRAQASAYAKWAKARLPSEAEWEFAATSGGTGATYPWGNERPSCERSIMDDGGKGCGQGGTWPVCSKPKGHSKQGACDLAGNVWEWTADWYHGDVSDNPSDGSPYMQAADDRVIRGGSWYSAVAGIFAARTRNVDDPGNRNFALGFRLARSL